MDNSKLHNKKTLLNTEIDAVIKQSKEAQCFLNDDLQFLRQVSLLFNRIHILEAIKRDVDISSLYEVEKGARSVGCDE